MPYQLTDENGRYCVNGKCYDSRADALAYLRALEANVPDAHKAADRPTSPDEYAYVPDKDKPSTWKLPIDTPERVSQAIDALSGDKNAPHGRGVDIPADARAGVVSKISGRIGKLNVSDDKKQALRDKLKPHQHKALFATPQPVGMFSRMKDGISIYKDVTSGRRYMFIVTSNSYKDRENETIATKALQAYVDRAWAVEDKCLPRNPLYFWHDGDPIGDVVWTDMEGPFLLEVAKERPNKPIRLTTHGRIWKTTIKHIWDAIEKGTYRWGASHGFRVPDGAFEDGVYKRIAKFESSVLPLDAAANPYTFAGVVDDMNKDKVLDGLLKTPGVADKLRKGVRTVKQELDKRGLAHKALEDRIFKGKLDEALQIIQQAFDKIGGAVPDGFAAETLQNLVAAMAGGDTGEPDGDAGMDTAYMADDMTADNEAPAPDEEKEQVPVMAGKQIKLLDRLIKSQEALVNDSETTREAMGKVAKMVQPLADVPTSVKALEDRLAALEKRFAGAPRRASVDTVTIVDDKVLTQKAKEQEQRYEELFPGSGIKIKSADNGVGGK